jgi:hypothetical protein
MFIILRDKSVSDIVPAVRVDLTSTQTASRAHCELFPYENRVTPVVLEELKQMIMHAAAGGFLYDIVSPRARH